MAQTNCNIEIFSARMARQHW